MKVMQNKIVKIIFKSNKLQVEISSFFNHLKLLELGKIHNLEVNLFMYEMKVRSFSNVFKNYFQSIAAIHSYNIRQVTNNKYYHPRSNKKKKRKEMMMSIKLSGMRLWNNLSSSLVEQKLKLGRKCFVKAAQKQFLNLEQQSS